MFERCVWFVCLFVVRWLLCVVRCVLFVVEGCVMWGIDISFVIVCGLRCSLLFVPCCALCSICWGLLVVVCCLLGWCLLCCV